MITVGNVGSYTGPTLTSTADVWQDSINNQVMEVDDFGLYMCAQVLDLL